MKEVKNAKAMMEKIGVDSIENLADMFHDQEWVQFLSMFKIIDVIGSGGFGVVVSAMDLKYNKRIALKIALKQDHKGDMLMKEYNILKGLNHQNLIKMYSLLNFSNYLIMSLKLCRESVYDFQERRLHEGHPLNDLECSQIACGLVSGLQYMHDEKNLIHRDLKRMNVLVSNYKDLTQCKIIDFGLAS